jgi:hypothetical protein
MDQMLRIEKSGHSFEAALHGLVSGVPTVYLVPHCKYSNEEHIFLDSNGTGKYEMKVDCRG